MPGGGPDGPRPGRVTRDAVSSARKRFARFMLCATTNVVGALISSPPASRAPVRPIAPTSRIRNKPNYGFGVILRRIVGNQKSRCVQASIERMRPAVGNSVVATHMSNCRSRWRFPIAMRRIVVPRTHGPDNLPARGGVYLESTHP